MASKKEITFEDFEYYTYEEFMRLNPKSQCTEKMYNYNPQVKGK